MKHKVFIIISLLVYVCITSCGNTGNVGVNDNDSDSITVVDESETEEVQDSLCLGHDSLFCIDLAKNITEMSDVARVNLLADSKFWSEDTLSKQQYIVMFNYLIDHQYVEKDEQIADFMFEHFKSDASFKEFDAYYKLYPDPLILETLTFELMSAWSNENESISESDFKSKFRYLSSNGCMKYFRTLKALEK